MALRPPSHWLPGKALLCVFACLGAAAAQVPLGNTYPLPAPPAASASPTLPVPPPQAVPEPAYPVQLITIPGPLRSLLRMAGLSQKAQPAEVLPLLARHIFQDGYQTSPEGSIPTEYLTLIQHYLAQATQLQTLAGSGHTIRATCDDSDALLHILGYRIVHGCGNKDTALQTADPERAFLTVDSGFPVTDLEESLQKNVPFVHPYASSTLPILLHQQDWVVLAQSRLIHAGAFVEVILNDPAIARLYWALSQMDAETARSLQHTNGLERLIPVATILNFYGSQISIRAGHVLVPGGAAAEPAWANLVGASPASPASFVLRLCSRDDGWLAAYFDVLSRVDPAQQARLTQPDRLQPYYEAFRPTTRKGAAGSKSFREASQLLILDTRLAWQPDGTPHVPGSLDAWRALLADRSNPQSVRDFIHHNHPIDSPRPPGRGHGRRLPGRDRLRPAAALPHPLRTGPAPLRVRPALARSRPLYRLQLPSFSRVAPRLLRISQPRRRIHSPLHRDRPVPNAASWRSASRQRARLVPGECRPVANPRPSA